MFIKRYNPASRKIALFLSLTLIFQTIFPAFSWALTSGPSQPEFNSFEPVATSQMVDPFTGAFVYNIPLFELPGPDGGYPFNLSYKPDGNIDSESGPFGMGWTINPGIVSRNLRGVPDDANGDELKITSSIKDNWTVGLDFAASPVELVGLAKGQLGLGIYYNSYRGLGANTSLGISASLSEKKSIGSFGLELSADTQDGFNLSPSINIGDILSASTSINSRRGIGGINLTLSVSKPFGKKEDDTDSTDPKDSENPEDENSEPVKKSQKENPSESTEGGDQKSSPTKRPLSIGSNISFPSQSFSPVVGQAWKTSSISGKVKLGVSGWTIFANAEVGGSFIHQTLKNKGKEIGFPQYGYLYAESGKNIPNAIMDFQREKDSEIRKFSPNLGMSMTTPDVYSVTGQGFSGMFRPYRNDIGVLFDPVVVSEGGGGSFGGDAGILHGGLSYSKSYSYSSSGKWNTANNRALAKFDFKEFSKTENQKKYIFRTQGDKIGEDPLLMEKYAGGENPLTFLPQGSVVNAPAISSELNYLDQNSASYVVKNLVAKREFEESRKSGTLVQDFTHKEAKLIPLLKSNLITQPIELNDDAIQTATYNRPTSAVQSSKIGGFIASDLRGAKYIYGIPAMNITEEQYVFSVNAPLDPCAAIVEIEEENNEIKYNYNETDKFLEKKVKPAYAHSYLLTGVVGADYVDVTKNGISEDDLGYWIKFNYFKVQDNYKWRSPFQGAFYDDGIKSKKSDDKGSFTYGEKEIWMLGTVESKSHVAVFRSSDRSDGIEAKEKFNSIMNSPSYGSKKQRRVDQIQLFSKRNYNNYTNPQFDGELIDELPLRTVHFGYNYDISGAVPNSITGKKMSLETVHFNSELSKRGEKNKYIFDYGLDNFNPDYSPIGFDRWGNFIENNQNLANDCGNLDFPYSKQYASLGENLNEPLEELINKNASVWNLREITLPSGSKMKIDWEANRYGYVQNKIATQMMEVNSVHSSVLNSGIFSNVTFNIEGKKCVRVVIDAELDANGDAKFTPDKYFQDLPQFGNEDGKQLYYKFRTRLKQNHALDEYQDISGYLNIVRFEGIDDDRKIEIYVERLKAANSNYFQYNPFQIGAWQFMKVQTPEQLLSFSALSSINNSTDGKSAVKKLGSMIGSVLDLFSGFYKRCEANQFAGLIDLNHSYVKLNVPDGEKFGGGARVSKIELEDDWDNDIIGGNTYGQKYDYFDGVATNEPQIGSDENAIKYAKVFPNNIPLATDEVHFFEYPINESLYPGPTIGYTKVEIRSLATYLDEEKRNGSPNLDWLPDGISTTGKVVHEFYTAKDFPVLTKQTAIEKDPYKKFKISFPDGVVNSEKMLATQGYSIIVNDMHGKPRKISNFAQSNSGEYLDGAYNWVEYKYKDKESTIDGKKVRELENIVDVLSAYQKGDEGISTETKRIGVDYELVNDMRSSYMVNTTSGGQFNGDFLPIFPGLPIPMIWPNRSVDEIYTATVSTNKYISKVGILEETISWDGESEYSSKNILFDKYTGQPLLSKNKNSYNNYIFNLDIPKHLIYEKNGLSSETIDDYISCSIDVSSCIIDNSGILIYDETLSSRLFENDELLILTKNNNELIPHGVVSIVQKSNDNIVIRLEDGYNGPTNDIYLKKIKSGQENSIGSVATQITTNENPLDQNIATTANTCEISYVDCLPTKIINPLLVTMINMFNLMLINGDFFMNNLDIGPDSPYAQYSSILNQELIGNGYAPFYEFSYGNGNLLITNTNGNSGIVFNSLNSQCQNFDPINSFTGYTGDIRLQIGNVCSDDENIVLINILEGNNSNPLLTLSLSAFWQVGEVGSYYFPTIDGCEYEILSDGELNVQKFELQNALNISASPSFDKAIHAYPILSDNINEIVDRESRIHKSTAYFDDRSADGTVFSGLMSNVELYNFNDPFFDDCSKWKTIGNVTKFGKTEPIESRDAIGVYSSILKGYDDHLVIGVASNARESEIAFESFEEFESGENLNQALVNCDNQCTYNSSFGILNPSFSSSYQSYEVYSGHLGGIILAEPYSLYDRYNTQEAILAGQFQSGETFVKRAHLSEKLPVDPNLPGPALVYNFIDDCLDVDKLLNVSNPKSFWKGKIFFKDKMYFDASDRVGYDNVEICQNNCQTHLGEDILAHSGDKYLKIESGETFRFPLERLRLESNKKYQFSAWVKRDVMNPMVGDGIISIVYDTNSQTVMTKPRNVIDGWMKVEVEFNGGLGRSLEIVAEDYITYTQSGNSTIFSSPIYIDDMRIHPIESNMVTHVYDPLNYKLRASLDDNNFATFYQYDEEGNLNTVKKETERGIKTIQYNQSYLIEQNQ